MDSRGDGDRRGRDRSAPLPTGGYLEQADGTAWMALFADNMLEIAIERGLRPVAVSKSATSPSSFVSNSRRTRSSQPSEL
jgi:hypothetical protein